MRVIAAVMTCADQAEGGGRNVNDLREGEMRNERSKGRERGERGRRKREGEWRRG